MAGSAVIERKVPAMIAGDFTPGFRASLHLKDLGFVERAAAEAGLPLEVTALVTQRVRSLVATGRGELDHGALLLSAAEQAGQAETPLLCTIEAAPAETPAPSAPESSSSSRSDVTEDGVDASVAAEDANEDAMGAAMGGAE